MAMKNNLHHILLIRTDRIGDVVLTTPTVSWLRKYYPHARIAFLTRAYTAPLLRHYSGIDEILIYRPEEEHAGLRGHLRLARQLKSHRFDAAFLFFPQPGLSLALYRAGIPLRVGSGYRWSAIFLNRRIFEHRKKGEKHELEYNFSLLRDFVPRLPHPEEVVFDFQRDETLLHLRQKALNKLGLTASYAIIHPGSGGSAPRLPIEQFARIAHYLQRHSALQLLIVGNGKEQNLVNDLLQQLPSRERIHAVVGEWDLETYMGIIAGSRLFISNSTGPLHIARAFDVPVLAFYCPATPCSPKRWGPYNRLDSVLTPDISPCKSCNIKRCPYGNCLSHIPWNAIENRLQRILAGLNDLPRQRE